MFAIGDSREWIDRNQYDWDQRNATPAEKEKYQYACYSDLKGTLSMSLKDANGHMVFQFTKNLSELTWSRAGEEPPEQYDQKTVNFTPDNREYVLEVVINPDPMLKADEGWVVFRGGGREPLSIGF